MNKLYILSKSALIGVALAGFTISGSALAHEGAEGALPDGKEGVLFIAMGPSNNFAMIDLATERVMKAVAGQLNPH